MAQAAIQNRAFHDDDAAREALEAARWPDGPVCPHCGNLDQEKIAKGKGKVHRPGLYYCAACNGQFTVTVGTVMERSKIPLSKWLFAMHLMGASKKGMSALQLSRMLGITYKSAWFLCHRIREAMDPFTRGPIGGENKVVESDETFIGGKAKNRAFTKMEPKKHAVLALVDREGNSYSFHIANVKAQTLRENIVKTVAADSHLMTDELVSYSAIGREFAGHTTVNHSADEYVRLGGFAHVNNAEACFSLMKRAVFGTHHSISEAHLSRYLAEWDFKYNTRNASDGERAALIAKGIEGKRLTYRPTHGNHEPRPVH
jgi:transposase-like protein